MNNKHLSLNKEINNNFIIASRAYFLQNHLWKDCYIMQEFKSSNAFRYDPSSGGGTGSGPGYGGGNSGSGFNSNPGGHNSQNNQNNQGGYNQQQQQSGYQSNPK